MTLANFTSALSDSVAVFPAAPFQRTDGDAPERGYGAIKTPQKKTEPKQNKTLDERGKPSRPWKASAFR